MFKKCVLPWRDRKKCCFSCLWLCPALSSSLSPHSPVWTHTPFQRQHAGAPPGSSLGLFCTHSSILQTAGKSILNYIRLLLLCLTSFHFPNMFQIKPEALTAVKWYGPLPFPAARLCLPLAPCAHLQTAGPCLPSK